MTDGAVPPSRLRLSAFGAVVEILCPQGDMREACLRALPDIWRPAPDAEPDIRYSIERRDTPGAGALYRFWQDDLLLGDGCTALQTTALLAGRVDYHLGEHARTCAFIHAAVVLHQGRALVFPGRTHAGKSTLAAALAAAGAEYVSDDVAVITPAGEVHFLSRAITLREDVARWQPSPAVTGSPVWRPGTARVGAILALTYKAGKRGLDIEPMSRGEAIQHLMANSMNGRTRPELVFSCCTAASSLAVCASGWRGDARISAPAILSACIAGRTDVESRA